MLFCSSYSADRLHDFYVIASHNAPWKLLYFVAFPLFAFHARPRAWPETDSMVRVMSGAFVGIISSRALYIAGEVPPVSLRRPPVTFISSSSCFVSLLLFVPEEIPFDTDLPLKFIVYAMVGLMVGEGCPAVFSFLQV